MTEGRKSPGKKRRKRHPNRLAYDSLWLAVLGLSIPAVICGHIARARCMKLSKPSEGVGIAKASIIIGYSQIGLIAIFALCFPLVARFHPIPSAVKEHTTRTVCYDLKKAIERFRREYERYPVNSADAGGGTVYRSDSEMMRVLMGSEELQGGELNPRSILFFSHDEANLQLPERMRYKGSGPFRDIWGQEYFILLDSDGDSAVSVPKGDFPDSGKLIPQGVLVWSAGPDGVSGTGDDVKGWGDF